MIERRLQLAGACGKTCNTTSNITVWPSVTFPEKRDQGLSRVVNGRLLRRDCG